MTESTSIDISVKYLDSLLLNHYKNYFNEDDIVICADGGVKHLINLQLLP